MNLSLFSQNLILVFCGLSVALSTYLILKVGIIKAHIKLLLITLASSLLIATLLSILIGLIFQAGDDLPSKFWLMLLPVALSICLPAAFFFSTKRKQEPEKKPTKRKKVKVTKPIPPKVYPMYIAASLNVMSCLVLSSLVINSYYHYYPTLYSAIGVGESRAAVISSDNQVLLQYDLNSHKLVNQSNIEASIYSKNTAPTNGKLYSLYIPGIISGFKPRSGWLYVSAIAVKSPSLLKLPVLVLLPGVPGNPTDWINGGGLQATMDGFAKTHHGITPLVYVADDTGTSVNDTECVNSPRGNVETYLTADVPNYIEKHFNVSHNPANWAIGGLSMGGMCSVMLTLTNPNVYHYFLDIGGEEGPEVGSEEKTIDTLFGGSEVAWSAHQPDILLKSHEYTGIGGFFATAKEDTPQVVIGTKELYIDSQHAGLDTESETIEGQHTFSAFSQLFKDALPWVSNRIGATECSNSATCD
jgi:S-formylglutathione hydrolase FrmB